MLDAGCTAVSLPEPLVRYRLRGDSLARRLTRDAVIALQCGIAAAHARLYDDHGSEVYRILTANGPGYLWNNPTLAQPGVELRDFLDEGYEGLQDAAQRLELLRMANSKLGSRLLRLAFKLRLNRLLR